ncbi:MAG TPA: hypothetical protein VJ583_09530, partial [Nitrososphaeraceae archaeon]|nr:hypothetical protein [Nitrososphaeraceae archaeon]
YIEQRQIFGEKYILSKYLFDTNIKFCKAWWITFKEDTVEVVSPYKESIIRRIRNIDQADRTYLKEIIKGSKFRQNPENEDEYRYAWTW